MTMAKEGTRTPEAVLATIEEELRRDEQIWERIHRDLRGLGAPRPRRTWRWVAAGAAVLVLVAGSFVVGRTTAPAPAPTAAVAQAATPFPASSLESKREGFEARYGSVFGWGPAVPAETQAPREEAPSVGSSLGSKQQGLAARGVTGSH
ncbi:MAG: hypothetical protein ACM3OO_03580 [Planctomycetaceae bacterium]